MGISVNNLKDNISANLMSFFSGDKSSLNQSALMDLLSEAIAQAVIDELHNAVVTGSSVSGGAITGVIT